MSQSRYGLKASLLKKKYEPFVEEFKQHHDDRILVPNMLDQLLEACEAMQSMENNFVCVAFNNAFSEQNETMEEIVTRFTGKVWNGYKWIEVEGAKVVGRDKP